MEMYILPVFLTDRDIDLGTHDSRQIIIIKFFGQGQLCKGSSNRMLPQFQEPILG